MNEGKSEYMKYYQISKLLAVLIKPKMKVACKHYLNFCPSCLSVLFSEHVVTFEDVKELKQRLNCKL